MPVCSKCKVDKLQEEFHKDKYTKSGYRPSCKKCCNKYRKRYYQDNKENCKEYYRKNKDSLKEYSKQWYQENKKYKKEYNKQWRKGNKEKIKKSNKKWYQRNKKYKKEQSKKYYLNNKEKRNKQTRQWYKNNKKRKKKYIKQWKKDNPEKVRRQDHKRKALTKKASIQELPVDYEFQLYQEQNRLCYYCYKKIKYNVPNTHLEHKQPLSQGGSHSMDNICLACKDCNSRKSMKTEKEFWNEI